MSSRIAQVPMSTSDLQGLSSIAGLFKLDFFHTVVLLKYCQLLHKLYSNWRYFNRRMASCGSFAIAMFPVFTVLEKMAFWFFLSEIMLNEQHVFTDSSISILTVSSTWRRRWNRSGRSTSMILVDQHQQPWEYITHALQQQQQMSFYRAKRR